MAWTLIRLITTSLLVFTSMKTTISHASFKPSATPPSTSHLRQQSTDAVQTAAMINSRPSKNILPTYRSSTHTSVTSDILVQKFIMTALTIVRTGHSILLLMFRSSLFFFSPLNLRGRLADRHQTLPDVRWLPRFMKFSETFWGPFPRNLVAQKH